MTAITHFWGEYRFLSNFYPVVVMFDGAAYASVENAYQAAKTLDLTERQGFTNCTPGYAKRRGKGVTLREDWKEVKYEIMSDLLEQKFTSSPALRQKLVSTGDCELIEGNSWGDKVWGCVWEDDKWVGKNVLGKMLMELRDK